eukprot:JZ550959.1.p1 GENE.JZ550959.1~~JZ550959.1.p1  ORF type:complete len:114 (-),score=36.69 JZ550959.1:5-346(-)
MNSIQINKRNNLHQHDASELADGDTGSIPVVSLPVVDHSLNDVSDLTAVAEDVDSLLLDQLNETARGLELFDDELNLGNDLGHTAVGDRVLEASRGQQRAQRNPSQGRRSSGA